MIWAQCQQWWIGRGNEENSITPYRAPENLRTQAAGNSLREESALAGVMRNWNKNWKNSKSLGSAPREFHVCIADMKLLCEKWHW